MASLKHQRNVTMATHTDYVIRKGNRISKEEFDNLYSK